MRQKNFASLVITALLSLSLFLTACNPTPTPAPTNTPQPPTPEPATPTPETPPPTPSDPLDLVDTAIAAGDFTTLVSALQAADLEEKLRSAGPFTIFAPTDEAFAALPAEMLDDPDIVFDILLYHVIDGAFMASDISEVETLTTLLGDDLIFTLAGGEVKVNEANITTSNIAATNGVIHVIDQVLLPPDIAATRPAIAAGLANLMDTVLASDELSTLVDGLAAADLLDRLREGGPYTVFAPTDDAFLDLVDASSSDLVFRLDHDPAPFLLYHVLPGRMLLSDIRDGMTVDTLAGSAVAFVLDGEKARVNGANLVTTNLRASNGVVHVIDSVILPPDYQ